MQWMERKCLLGSGYQYDKWMSEDEVARLGKEAPADFADRTAMQYCFKSAGNCVWAMMFLSKTIPDHPNGSAMTAWRRTPVSTRGRCFLPSTVW